MDLTNRINSIGDDSVQDVLNNIVKDYMNQGVSADVAQQNIIKMLENIKTKN